MIDPRTTLNRYLDRFRITKIAIDDVHLKTLKSPMIPSGSLKDPHCVAV
jgi:hypothetical protein